MQNAIPAAAELPIVSLIPEIRVYTGQNQIRRNVGLFASNIQGQTVTTSTQILAPGASTSVTSIAAFVLSATATLELTMAYHLVSTTPLTAVINSSLLLFDQGLDTLTLKNNQAVDVEFTLIAVGPAPTVT